MNIRDEKFKFLELFDYSSYYFDKRTFTICSLLQSYFAGPGTGTRA
jgi:hypothetical protein